MNIFLDEHKKLILQLLGAKVEFILVGGYAVIYHGYGRTTGDMDIWIKPDNENKIILSTVLAINGIIQQDLDELIKMDFTRPLAFHLDEAPRRVDFLTHLSGLNYDEANKMKVFLSIEGKQVPVLHLDHLIINKLSSNRIKDKADVEELQKIMQLKKKEQK